jgi:hypothetical protein
MSILELVHDKTSVCPGLALVLAIFNPPLSFVPDYSVRGSHSIRISTADRFEVCSGYSCLAYIRANPSLDTTHLLSLR